MKPEPLWIGVPWIATRPRYPVLAHLTDGFGSSVCGRAYTYNNLPREMLDMTKVKVCAHCARVEKKRNWREA